MNAGDAGNNNEPEPEEHIDLLVNDVQRKYAKPVKLFNRSGGTKFVESAFGHLWKHHIQWIPSAHKVLLWHSNYIRAIGTEVTWLSKKKRSSNIQLNANCHPEITSKETVNEENLSNDVD